MEDFDSRFRLVRARAAGQPGARVPHTVVILPSYSMSDSLLAHYAHRIPALEHRQLLWLLSLSRTPALDIIFVTSVVPESSVLGYYLSLVPPEHRRDMRARTTIIEVPDTTQRSVSAKLLDRPDLIGVIRSMTAGKLAYIDPWNVTPLEMEVARRLDLPLNGTAAELWPLGFKSNGRRVMRSAGVPLPLGREDVCSVEEVVHAAETVRRELPDAAGVVIKTDNSGTGDGNRIVEFAEARTAEDLRRAVEALEPWYLSELRLGAVVEELVVGRGFGSPSVQVDIAPDGRVDLLSTHDQILEGCHGQRYAGCRFPADPGYRGELAAYGAAVGEVLAGRGALGRFSLDFAAVHSADGEWRLYGLEINLRKTGTTHPMSVLHNLVPGRYDVSTGGWLTDNGSERCYRSTDNLVQPGWRGRDVGATITAVRSAGLEFDRRSRTGVVLHMFSGLEIDGRLGLTAVGVSPAHAEELYQAAEEALCRTVADGIPA